MSRQHRKKLDDYPTRTAPLIKECVDAMADWQRNKGDGWPSKLDGHAVLRVLGPLALMTFEKSTGEIKRPWLDELSLEDRSVFFDHLVRARFV